MFLGFILQNNVHRKVYTKNNVTVISAIEYQMVLKTKTMSMGYLSLYNKTDIQLMRMKSVFNESLNRKATMKTLTFFNNLFWIMDLSL